MPDDEHQDIAAASKIAAELVDVLMRADMKCAIGGAIALGFWAPPRGTKDADLNVFVGEGRYGELLDVLEGAGCTPALDRTAWTAKDREKFLRRCREGEVAVVYKDNMRVDVFVPSIDFYAEAERRVRTVPLRGQLVPVLSAETLSVFKLLFFRDKDLVDLRRLVAHQKAALDHGWVRRHIVDMMGEDDERVAAWDRIVRTHGGS